MELECKECALKVPVRNARSCSGAIVKCARELVPRVLGMKVGEANVCAGQDNVREIPREKTWSGTG